MIELVIFLVEWILFYGTFLLVFLSIVDYYQRKTYREKLARKEEHEKEAELVRKWYNELRKKD
jgi:hypothetical protein